MPLSTTLLVLASLMALAAGVLAWDFLRPGRKPGRHRAADAPTRDAAPPPAVRIPAQRTPPRPPAAPGPRRTTGRTPTTPQGWPRPPGLRTPQHSAAARSAHTTAIPVVRTRTGR